MDSGFSQQMSGHPAQRISAQLHTPSQSFSTSPSQPTPEAASSQLAVLKDRKTENDKAKARLSDQKFDIKHYPDPLLPRKDSSIQFNPRGVTVEMEAQLQELVAKLKAKA